MRMGKVLRVAIAWLMASGAVGDLARPAAAEEKARIDAITVEGCDIVVTFTVGDPAAYHVVVYDDGRAVDDVPVVAGRDATVQARYTITTAVGQGSSGLGIGVEDGDGYSFDYVDPYNGADAVIDACVAQQAEPGAAAVGEVAPGARAPAPAATPVAASPRYC
ncbi:MAG TPA: hypothetical protein VFI47_10310 [Acidimicrobiales bacterium]|nr:hypothetical protein [Acidimicrobiales bacterium]